MPLPDSRNRTKAMYLSTAKYGRTVVTEVDFDFFFSDFKPLFECLMANSNHR
jgi:hypothetical protein